MERAAAHSSHAVSAAAAASTPSDLACGGCEVTLTRLVDIECSVTESISVCAASIVFFAVTAAALAYIIAVVTPLTVTH